MKTGASSVASHCRALGAAPPIGHHPLAAPTGPSEKVRCRTTQAPAIRTESDTAIAASTRKYKGVMKNPGWTSRVSKIR